MLTYFYCNSFIPHPPSMTRGISSTSSTSLVYPSPCHLIPSELWCKPLHTYILSVLNTPPPLLPYTYITLLLCSHFTYTSLFLIYHSSPHFSYERFASFILISSHCLIQTPSRITISAITLRYRCTTPPLPICTVKATSLHAHYLHL